MTDQGTEWRLVRRQIWSRVIPVGLAGAAFALSCGAVCAAAGLSVAQTLFLSGVMFTGASQFALAGILLAHGSGISGMATALLLGSRNALYGLRLSPSLDFRGLVRPLSALFVIDETTAVTIVQDSVRARRYAFWAMGLVMFTFWNVGCLLGTIGARAISDPKVLGLDAAGPAAFVALLAPHLRSRQPWALALAGAGLALVTVPFVPAGVPVLLAAGSAFVISIIHVRMSDHVA